MARSIVSFSRLLLLVAAWFVVASGAVVQAAPAGVIPPPVPGYRLAAGDTVSIAVFNEAELSVTVRIGDNGRVAYPFLGEMLVAGKTPAELERSIADALRGDYLVDPRVSVTVTEYRPFFVNGQVKNPGSYAFQPGMTVRKAISLAGGLTERASDRKITLIPEARRGSKDGKRVGMDDAVGPGDIITVEESFF